MPVVLADLGQRPGDWLLKASRTMLGKLERDWEGLPNDLIVRAGGSRHADCGSSTGQPAEWSARQAGIVENLRRPRSDPEQSLVLSISSLQWAVGVFCAIVGALMLVAPHQFATPAYAPLQSQLSWWGIVFLVVGAAMLAVATLAPRLRYTVLAHLCAAAVLLVLAAGFASTGTWSGTSNYLVLGVGTALAPIYGPTWSRRGWLQGEAFSFVIGLAATATGVILLMMPGQFSTPLYDLARPYLGWYGAAFVVGGSLLCVCQVRKFVPPAVGRWTPLLLAAVFFAFGSSIAIPTRLWTGVAYYGGFGVALVVLAWLGPRLRRLDPGSLRTRLALVLAAAAAVPLLVLVPLYAQAEESQAVNDYFVRQQVLAGGIAQNVADYVSLHQAAVLLMASEPGLLGESPGEQRELLKRGVTAYPDVIGFGTVDANGDSVARSDERSGTSWIGDQVFEDVRRTGRPGVGVRISPVIHRAIFNLGAPIFDADGNFAGMLASSLESSRVAALISRTDFGNDALIYLVDGVGRVIAHPDLDLVATFSDMSATPAVAALLSHPNMNGSLAGEARAASVLASYAHVPELGWGIIVEQPTAEALAPTRNKLDLLFGGLLLTIGAAAAFGVLAAGWLGGPLATLGAAVDGLAAGDGDAPLPAGGLTEVVGLANAFSAMRSRLSARTAEREQAVEALSRSEERYRLAIQATREVIYDHDLLTDLIVWSPVTMDVFGFEPVDMGFTVDAWQQHIHPQDRPGVQAGVADHNQRGGSYVMEYRHSREDGTYADIKDRGQVVQDADGQAIRVVGAMMDVTEQRAIEHMKDAFVATVSHELRTPLNGIVGVSQLLLGTLLDTAQQEYAEIIHRSSQALHRLIDDVLTLARYQSGKVLVEQRDLDVRLALEDVTALLLNAASDKGIEIVAQVDHDVPRGLRGDAGRLRQILLNLAGNALKFTDSGSVLLRARVVDSDADRVNVRFEVQDTGIGIDAEVQLRLFQPFEQADTSTTTRYGGTGLGLAICRQLVESMGGQIGLESAAGSGSTFWFELPLERGEAPDLTGRASLAGLRVLLTCDAAVRAAALHELVQAWSMLGTIVVTADEAIATLRAARGDGAPFDVVIIALDDAAGAGARLARGLSREPSAVGQHVILVASADELKAISADAPGVTVMSGPVRSSQLFDTLAHVFGADPQRADGGTPSAIVPRGAGEQILVVEDAPMNQLVVRRALERLGYQPVIAGSGQAALSLLADAEFAVVLMDCRMPQMDGFETTQLIRTREVANRLRRVPIVALTANAQDGDRDKCLSAGMDDYMSKPLDLDKLARTLQQWTSVDRPAELAAPISSAIVLQPSALDRVREVQTPGEADLLTEMIEAFLADSPQHLAQIADALASNDSLALANAAHALKGGAAYLGAEALQRVCLELETRGRSGVTSASDGLLESLQDVFDRTRVALVAEIVHHEYDSPRAAA